MYQFKRIVGLDENNEKIAVQHDVIGNKIYIKSISGTYIIEYYAYPEIITETTSDEYELEIDQDAQLILPYAVANDILKVDPRSDYTAFLAEYQKKIEALDTRKILPSIEIEEKYNI